MLHDSRPQREPAGTPGRESVRVAGRRGAVGRRGTVLAYYPSQGTPRPPGGPHAPRRSDILNPKQARTLARTKDLDRVVDKSGREVRLSSSKLDVLIISLRSPSCRSDG
jgi:hypothetical protein